MIVDMLETWASSLLVINAHCLHIMNNIMAACSFKFFLCQPAFDHSIMIPLMDKDSKQAQSQKGRRVHCGQNLA
jgi:hypothetical protein